MPVDERALRLRPTVAEDLDAIAAMEREGDTARFVTAQTAAEHAAEMARAEIVYRTAVAADGGIAGFVVLVLEDDGESVELRRIVVRERGRGHGTLAMRLAERECREEFGRRRIWLDVFHYNDRARRVYEAGGYIVTGTGEARGEKLYILERPL